MFCPMNFFVLNCIYTIFLLKSPKISFKLYNIEYPYRDDDKMGILSSGDKGHIIILYHPYQRTQHISYNQVEWISNIPNKRVLTLVRN